MFAGHYGAGLGAKAADRLVPLWVLFLAVQFLDVVWSALVLVGVEEVKVVPGLVDASDFDFTYYPYSHSLVAAVAWSVLAYALVRIAAPRSWRSPRAAVVVGAAVFSHWPLDLVVHRSDMPLFADSGKVGLDLWSSAPVTFVVELLIVAAGLALYLRATEATSRFGTLAPWVLAAILVGSGYSTVFGSSSDVDSAAVSALVGTLVVFPALAWLVELGRRPRATEPAVGTASPREFDARPTIAATR